MEGQQLRTTKSPPRKRGASSFVILDWLCHQATHFFFGNIYRVFKVFRICDIPSTIRVFTLIGSVPQLQVVLYSVQSVVTLLLDCSHLSVPFDWWILLITRRTITTIYAGVKIAHGVSLWFMPQGSIGFSSCRSSHGATLLPSHAPVSRFPCPLSTIRTYGTRLCIQPR